jgi:two-component system cell cycle response regulator
MGLAHFDPLRLCSQLRSLESTRDLPILMVADLDDRMRVLRGLDLGANDYILRPIDRNELLARVRMQIRRKFYADALRENVRASIELAMLDGLTGLFNRRHFDLNLPKLIESCLSRRRPLSLLVFDIDHFKRINDTHGHDVGDQVLRLLAQRLRGALRQSDLICRLGGEEFAVIMPDTDLDRAASVGNRVRLAIAEYPFAVGQGRGPIDVTISAGVAGAVEGLSPEMLYRRADAGLYRSKQAGRNRVCAAAA